MKSANSKARFVFWLALSFLLMFSGFGYATVIFIYKLPPYRTITGTFKWIESYMEHGRMAPFKQLVKRPKWANDDYIGIHDPDKVTDGYYSILAWDEVELGYKAKLFDSVGNILHTWSIDYDDLDPNGTVNRSYSPHGFLMLPDGSILVNFDKGDVLARIDTCSHKIWVNQGIYHHSLELAEDGNVWTWRGLNSAYDQYQYIVSFDPNDGSIVREIDFIEEVVNNPNNHFWDFVVGSNYKFRSKNIKHDSAKDIFHPNDVEELHTEFSREFPSFEPGDLLISLKTQNLVAVIDPESLIVKWWRQGPWRLQHDPDFLRDGTISVFNNNSKRWRSEIIRIDPDTGELFNELSKGAVNFYSDSQGKHQYLPDGNVLIVVPSEGRVLLVTPTGDKVMEFNNQASPQPRKNGRVLNAQWVPDDFFESFPACSG